MKITKVYYDSIATCSVVGHLRNNKNKTTHNLYVHINKKKRPTLIAEIIISMAKSDCYFIWIKSVSVSLRENMRGKQEKKN